MVSVGELKCLLDDPAAVLALGELHHFAEDLVDQERPLEGAAELDQLLNHVVAENVVDQGVGVGQHFLEDQVFEGLSV